MFLDILLLFIGALESKECNPPFKYHHQLDRCYFASNEKLPFVEAYTSCHTNAKGSLPSIHNAFQNQILLSINNNDSIPFWLGLYKKDKLSENWFWDDGSVVDYLNWEPMEEDPYRYTIMQQNGKWLKEDGNVEHFYFCVENEKDFACPKGWTWFGLTNSCYLMIYNMSFNSGERYCQGFGGHLASIHSRQEDDFVYELTAVPCPGERGIFHEVVLGGFWNRDQAKIIGWTDGSDPDYMGFPCYSGTDTVIRLSAVDQCGSCEPRLWILGDGKNDQMFTRLVCKAKALNTQPMHH